MKTRIRRIIFLGITLLISSTALSQTSPPGSNSTSSGSVSPNNAVATDTAKPLTLAEAVDLALKQASAYRTAQINELLVKEDVRQARAAFLPKITAPLNFIYTSPSIGLTRPRPPSFLGANAITEYQALLNAAGEIDTSGRLAATLKRNQALVESARSGSEVAKRDLIQAVADAYYNLALATTKRRGAESNLEAALEFENNTKLNMEAGEVAPVDLVRARLQTEARRDELEQSRADELVGADTLRFLVGRDFKEPIAAEDLLTQLPVPDEILRFSEAAIQTRPEFAQFEADRRAGEQDVNVARSERRPQLTYSVSSGFISDSFRSVPIKNQTGIQATVGFTIPVFDWGASRSRETQAKLRLQQAENLRLLAERQFALDFFSARSQALSAQERIRLLAISIRDAESNVNASLARYRAGEAPINEVVDAQNLLIAQRQALYKAIFDYQTAKSRLARASGR